MTPCRKRIQADWDRGSNTGRVGRSCPEVGLLVFTACAARDLLLPGALPFVEESHAHRGGLPAPVPVHVRGVEGAGSGGTARHPASTLRAVPGFLSRGHGGQRLQTG